MSNHSTFHVPGDEPSPLDRFFTTKAIRSCPGNPRSFVSLRDFNVACPWVALLAASLLVLSPSIRADYAIALQSGGLASRAVTTGETFDLDVVLSSPTGDHHDSVVMGLLFSVSGLVLQDFAWSDPYLTGGEDDASIPPRSALPVRFGAGTVSGSALPPESVDLFFSNLIALPRQFASGRLLRLTLLVPALYVGSELIRITVRESTLADGLAIIPASSSAFELRVTPATGTAQPPLAIQQAGNVLSISWPSLIANAVLESSSDPGGSNWVKAAASPLLVGDRYVATFTAEPTSPPHFFRLRFP